MTLDNYYNRSRNEDDVKGQEAAAAVQEKAAAKKIVKFWKKKKVFFLSLIHNVDGWWKFAQFLSSLKFLSKTVLKINQRFKNALSKLKI